MQVIVPPNNPIMEYAHASLLHSATSFESGLLVIILFILITLSLDYVYCYCEEKFVVGHS